MVWSMVYIYLQQNVGQRCVKFPLKDVVFLGKNKPQDMGMDRSGLLQLPPFLRDVELVIMSLILVLMAGYLGQTGGWVLEAGVAGCGRYFEAILPPKKLSHGHEKKEQKGSLWLDMKYCLFNAGILILSCFFLIIPNSSTVVGGHPLKKTQNNETCFFSPWLGWKFWIRVKYIQFFGPQNLKYLKKKSLTIQVCTTLVSKQRLPWKSLWPWKS